MLTIMCRLTQNAKILGETPDETFLASSLGWLRQRFSTTWRGRMSSTTMMAAREMEDALMYLPRKGVIEYKRGQVIYDEQHSSAGLYLVVKGRVKVSITMED